MNFINTINDIRNLGCEEQSKASVAARVFHDLKLDKRYVNIYKHYDRTLGIYLRLDLVDQTTAVVLPLLDSDELSFKIVDYLKNEFDDSKSITFFLAICDTYSNILYYKLAEGLQENLCHTSPSYK